MSRIFVKPVNGQRVLDPAVLPDPLPLPAEGKSVVPSTYWTRRVADGSVVIVATKAKKEK